ncbi:MAG: hypothetical protein KDK27_19345, partial [Leptospiraceae bacterium]|nr:hypothetical protein [Leptospiraceae bacterium]
SDVTVGSESHSVSVPDRHKSDVPEKSSLAIEARESPPLARDSIPGIYIYAGLSGTRERFPAGQNYILQTANLWKLPYIRHWRSLLESRGTYRTVIRPGSGHPDCACQSSFTQRLLASMAMRNPYFELFLGHRYLPGPRTNYLLDPDAFSLFKAIPAGRRSPTLLARIAPQHFWSPGILLVENDRSPGMYWALERSLLLAVQPARDSGGLSLDTAWRNGNWWTETYLDVQRNARTHAGYGRLHLAHRIAHTHFTIEGERREPWDYERWSNDVPELRRLCAEREGKSGAGRVQASLWKRSVIAQIAGEDRCQDGYRIADMELRLFPFSTWRPLIGISGRERRMYAPDRRDLPNNPSRNQERYYHTGAFMGLFAESRYLVFRMALLSRRSGARSFELGLGFHPGDWQFRLAAAYHEPTRSPGEFFTIQTNLDRESGIRFHDARAALTVRISGPYVQFYLRATQVDTHTTEAFMQVQGMATF